MKFLYHTYFLSSQFANVNSSQAYLKYSKPGLFYFCTHWEASIKVKYLHICQRLPCTGARTAWNSSEKTSSWQERNCWSTGTEEHSSGLFSKTVVGRASHPSGPRRKELRIWLQHNLLFRLWTLLSPAGSWKKAAPVVANGDFLGTAKVQEDICSCCSCHAAHCSTHAQSLSTCHAANTLTQARLVSPHFQTALCKSCIFWWLLWLRDSPELGGSQTQPKSQLLF